MTFGLQIESKEVLNSSGQVYTKEGEKFWVCQGSWGPTGMHDNMFGDLLTFKNADAAAKFARTWEGHPWWVKPNRKYRIVKLTPRLVQQGWKEET